MDPLRRLVLLVTAVSMSVVGVGHAEPVDPAEEAAEIVATDCAFGGPTPGLRAIRLDLRAEGSTFLTLELGGQREYRGVHDENNWHLAQGIFVVEESTMTLEAYRIASQGMAPRRVVAQTGSTPRVDTAAPAPDVPYQHFASRLRDGLPPAVYLVIAFGVDGGSETLNEWWSAGIQVSGTHLCTPIGSGSVFDYDHTRFGGRTQVYAPGVGYAESLSLVFEASRQIVVGLMDAETQARAASTVSLDYDIPSGSGSVSQRIVPFVSPGGAFSFEGSYAGAYPLLLIAGAAMDIPPPP